MGWDWLDKGTDGTCSGQFLMTFSSNESKFQRLKYSQVPMFCEPNNFHRPRHCGRSHRQSGFRIHDNIKVNSVKVEIFRNRFINPLTTLLSNEFSAN